MEWSGQHDFVSSAEVPFTVDGAVAGILKTHGPLSFLKVVVQNPMFDQICISFGEQTHCF